MIGSGRVIEMSEKDAKEIAAQIWLLNDAKVNAVVRYLMLVKSIEAGDVSQKLSCVGG
tara:strand:+ start:1348 stop:1521 length:174 start_codon:yes stop_codon:yes gene_type:complete